MTNLSIDCFENARLGDETKLGVVVGGATYTQTGSGSGPDGTTRDFEGDGGASDQCDVPDGKYKHE